jgi:hypothetical protein
VTAPAALHARLPSLRVFQPVGIWPVVPAPDGGGRDEIGAERKPRRKDPRRLGAAVQSGGDGSIGDRFSDRVIVVDPNRTIACRHGNTKVAGNGFDQ